MDPSATIALSTRRPSSSGSEPDLLPITAYQVRIFLHILAATIWIGGQITLVALVPVLRRGGTPDLVHAAARRYHQVAWPAYAVLLATGIWNLLELPVGSLSAAWQSTLGVKILLVATSGVSAAAHSFVIGPSVATASSEAAARRRRALSGATAGLALLSALAAAFFGVQL